MRSDNGLSKSYPVEKTNTVSTIGAGDNFNAGFVYGLLKHNITRRDIESGLTESQWDNLIATAQLFSNECCKTESNYVSKEFGEKMKHQ